MKTINGQKETEIQKVTCKLLNLGTVNKNEVTININSKGTLTLYFSYSTIVSFMINTPNKCRSETIQNYWSNTTGKLLNECQPDHKKRLNQVDFHKALNEAFNLLMI